MPIDQASPIDLRKAIGRNYGVFFLQNNPFPAIGIPRETILFTVDRVGEIKRFEDAIVELRATRQSNIAVLVGDYGSGKSHLLKLFEQSVNTQLLSTEGGTMGVYVRSPGEDFRDFFLEFMEGVGKQLLTQLSQSLVKRFFVEYQHEARSYVYDPTIARTIGTDVADLQSIVGSSRYHDLLEHVRRIYLPNIPMRDVCIAFLVLSHQEYDGLAWRWLLAEALQRQERELVGVSDVIDDDSKAFSALNSVLLLLGTMGISSFFIAVDELERIPRITGVKKVRYQNLLLELINAHPSNISYCFAIAPFQWSELNREDTALVRRLAGNWHLLDEFSEEHTRELIEKHLSFARAEDFSSKAVRERFPDCEVSLAPFQTASIEKIQSVTVGLVSSIELLCRRLIENLYDNYAPGLSISPEMVDVVAEREHLKRAVE